MRAGEPRQSEKNNQGRRPLSLPAAREHDFALTSIQPWSQGVRKKRDRGQGAQPATARNSNPPASMGAAFPLHAAERPACIHRPSD